MLKCGDIKGLTHNVHNSGATTWSYFVFVSTHRGLVSHMPPWTWSSLVEAIDWCMFGTEAWGIILGMRSANERRRYNVMLSLIDWVHTQNEPRGIMCWAVTSCIPCHNWHHITPKRYQAENSAVMSLPISHDTDVSVIRYDTDIIRILYHIRLDGYRIER